MDYLYISCECGDAEHVVRFFHDTDHDFDDVGVSVQMSHYLPWWRRVWVAVKFVFGVHERCHWVDTLIKPEERAQLADFLTRTARRSGDADAAGESACTTSTSTLAS